MIFRSLLAGIFAVSVIFGVSVYAQTQVVCNNGFNQGTGVSAGFGVPWNVTRISEMLVNVVSCTPTTATISVGSSNQFTYAYTKGYTWTGTTWQEFTLTGGTPVNATWNSGVPTATIQRAGKDTFYVGYVCIWDGLQWKCGCQNSACAQPSWQLQSVSEVFSGSSSTGSSGGSSSTSGSTSSGSSGGSSTSSSGGSSASCDGGQCSACMACGGNCNNCGGNRTIWVDGRNGSDGNNGLSQGNAFKTIQKGANTVRGGDVMIVRPGKYYERPTFSNLGSSQNNPVWIMSEIPGQAEISGLWRAADQGTVNWQSQGNGVYSASHGDAYSGSYKNNFLFRYKSRGDLQAGSVNGVSKPGYGMSPSGGQVYIRLPNNENPNGKSIQITDRFAQNIVRIQNSPYLIFDGFAVSGAGNDEAITVDAGSRNVTLRNLQVTHSRMAAQLLGTNGIIEWTEYSYPKFREFVDDLLDRNGNGNEAVYTLVKDYFSNNGNAYLEGGLATGAANSTDGAEFRYNYIHEVFDGERLGEFDDATTHHNVYDYNYDDHIQFEGWRGTHSGRNLRAHDNLFLNSAAVMLSHQDGSGGMQGPHYVYRNVIYVTDSKHSHPWSVIKNLNVKNKNIYYYHNVINNVKGPNRGWGNTNWLYWDASKGNADKLTFRNNIILFDDLTTSNGGTPTFNNNLLVNNRSIGKIIAGGGKYIGTNKSAIRFIDEGNLNFGLQSGSPAVNAGSPIPSSWPDSHRSQINGAPDAGAFELGENPGSNWPRPRGTAYTTSKPDRWNK